MRQHAGLRGDGVLLLDLFKAREHALDALGAVARRVQPQHCVARAVAQPLNQRGGDAVDVVRRMVRLQAAGERSRQADGRVAVGGDGDLLRGADEVEIAHEFADGGDHLTRQPAGNAADLRTARVLVKQPLAQLRNRPALDLVVNAFVQVVLNDARDLVFLVGNDGMLPQLGQQHLGQHDLCRDALLGALCGDACQLVAGFFLVCLGKHILEIAEFIGFSKKQRFQLHGFPPYYNISVLITTGST